MSFGQQFRCVPYQLATLCRTITRTSARFGGTSKEAIAGGKHQFMLKVKQKGNHQNPQQRYYYTCTNVVRITFERNAPGQLDGQHRFGQSVIGETPSRSKHKKISKGSRNIQEDEEDSDNEYTEELAQEALDPQDRPKEVIVHVSSLRVDVVFKSGHKMSRNKTEENFYQSRLWVNGEKVLKKGTQVELGDEIDLVKGVNAKSDQYIDVIRLHVVGIKLPKDPAAKIVLKLRRYKHLTIENYADAWTGNYMDS